jgi:DNA-binding transcriptional ArsR family regulator
VVKSSTTSLDLVFTALGDPTRRRIIERLARGSLTVGEIASGFAMSAPAISKHLKVLESSGMLVRDVVGRVHHCRLDPGAMHAAAAWIESQERFWNAALDRLDAELSRPTDNNDKKRKR